MALQLNANGLPLPGRELDAWIAEHVMRWRHIRSVPVGTLTVGNPPRHWSKAEDGAQVLVETVKRLPHYSTTAAFFQVMEALSPEYIWLFREDIAGIGVAMRPIGCDGHPGSFWECNLDWGDKPDREKLYAHAVCACVRKAMSDE